MENTTPHKTRKITRLSLFKSRTMLADLAEWQGPTLIPPNQTLRDTALWHILAGMAWKHQERIYSGEDPVYNAGARDQLLETCNLLSLDNAALMHMAAHSGVVFAAQAPLTPSEVRDYLADISEDYLDEPPNSRMDEVKAHPVSEDELDIPTNIIEAINNHDGDTAA